jgi:hypothetical protein
MEVEKAPYGGCYLQHLSTGTSSRVPTWDKPGVLEQLLTPFRALSARTKYDRRLAETGFDVTISIKGRMSSLVVIDTVEDTGCGI